jgi:hypothetical protein
VIYKSYTIAGYLSIALAFVLPLLFAFGLAETFIGKHMIEIGDPDIGPEDLATVLLAAAIVTVLLILRKLLNERYMFAGADRVIAAAVVWYIVITAGSFVMIFFADTTWPAPDTRSIVAIMVFFVLSMTSAGVIDIFLGLRLLQVRERKNELLKVFAYVTLVMGGLEVTVLLSPLALILMPVWCVTAAMLFLREKDEEQIL